jgi:hypothetical protein
VQLDDCPLALKAALDTYDFVFSKSSLNPEIKPMAPTPKRLP